MNASRKSGAARRNNPDRAQRPRCKIASRPPPHSMAREDLFQRNLIPAANLNLPPGRGINISGVDFWHAVEFSRNGRFLRPRLTGPSGRFPSVFPTLPDTFRTDFPARIPYPVPVGEGFRCAFRRGPYVSGFPGRLIIEPFGIEFRHAGTNPRSGRSCFSGCRRKRRKVAAGDHVGPRQPEGHYTTRRWSSNRVPPVPGGVATGTREIPGGPVHGLVSPGRRPARGCGRVPLPGPR